MFQNALKALILPEIISMPPVAVVATQEELRWLPDWPPLNGQALQAVYDASAAQAAEDAEAIHEALAAPAYFTQGPLAPALPRVESAARGLLARLLPRFYKNIPVTAGYVQSANPLASHQWTREKGHLIELAAIPADGRGDVASAFGSPNEARAQQKIEQLLQFVHEYAHVLFDASVGHSQTHAVDSAYAALTEGFAVAVEQLLIGRMLAEALPLGLTQRDAVDLRTLELARQKWLAIKDTHYAEGMLSWRVAYERGGEKGLLSFLATLSARRLSAVPRADPAYQLALDDPALLSAYLGDLAASPDRRALEAFGEISRGQAPSEDQRRAAASITQRVGPQAWRRLFDRTLLRDKRFRVSKPVANDGARWWQKVPDVAASVAPAFALARLNPLAAAELARYLVEIVQSDGGAEQLFESRKANGKAAAIIVGASSLPWDDGAQQQVWIDAVTGWLGPK